MRTDLTQDSRPAAFAATAVGYLADMGMRPMPRNYRRRADLNAALARAQRAVHSGSVDALEGPPPEVLREMLEAERAWQNLAAQGREVRFGTGADGRVSVELTDTAGHALHDLGPIGLFRLLKTES
jgi:hypothetical protein